MIETLERSPQSAAVERNSSNAFEVEKIRADFPILSHRENGNLLAYLDNAATSQKPESVIEAVDRYYRSQNSNIHRGVYKLSQTATDAYEEARTKIQKFLNASSPKEIIFTRGTTESINLVASAYGRRHIGEGDEIIISTMEHHSNIVPWQLLCEEKKAVLRVIPIDDAGEIELDRFVQLLNERTKLVAIVHASNSLGTINPVKQIIKFAHDRDVPVLVDGAQAVPHLPVDVRDLDCDFYTFSGHKVFAPTGIGVLYGKEELLEEMPPFQGGGDMIRSVTFEKTTFNDLPHKFEAGTPNIAGAIGLGYAIDYVSQIGYENILDYEEKLLDYATYALSSLEQVKLVGTARNKVPVLSFVIDEIHPHDVGTILDQDGIAVRTGHHCTQPVMDRYQLPATTRASLAFYNTNDEIDRLVKGLDKVFQLLS